MVLKKQLEKLCLEYFKFFCFRSIRKTRIFCKKIATSHCFNHGSILLIVMTFKISVTRMGCNALCIYNFINCYISFIARKYENLAKNLLILPTCIYTNDRLLYVVTIYQFNMIIFKSFPRHILM